MTNRQTLLPSYTDSIILGAGLGGLAMAIKLQEKGRNDFILIEKGNEVGGTWRDNSYPGSACDVQSHLYSYSFTNKWDWQKRYGGWSEIQDYILDTVKEYDLRPKVRFNLEVTVRCLIKTGPCGQSEPQTASMLIVVSLLLPRALCITPLFPIS